MQRIITWDLGATKCTAGLVEHDVATDHLHCKNKYTIKLAETSSLENLVQQLEAHLNFSFADADAICIGAAGHFDGKSLLHTNPYPYPMHFAKLADKQRWPDYAVIHDYASIICATFTSYMNQAQNIKRLNLCPMKLHGRRVAFGIGTGLGLKDGVQLPNGDFWFGENEMGHIGIPTPPMTEQDYAKRHQEIMLFLAKKFSAEDHQAITFERILTGKGMVNLHQFFYPNSPLSTPEEVGKNIQAGNAHELVNTFAWYAGLFVGTVQLSFMPEGGIWMTGGVALNHLEIFDQADFSAGIYASPAYLMQRQEYPLGILCNPEHALIGNAHYAIKRLLNTKLQAKVRKLRSANKLIKI